MKKYKLTGNTKEYDNKTLYQIQALKDFGGVKAGDLGGWIEKESNLSQEGDCWVYDNAYVFDYAQVNCCAKVNSNARIFDRAYIGDDAVITDDAHIYNDAMVFGNSKISGDTNVFCNASLSGDYNYSAGSFLGGNDSEDATFTNIADKAGIRHWKSQYVYGEYKIEPLDTV